ncbi:MAG: class I SAM-dependent methyltransferase [Rudaea sp.]
MASPIVLSHYQAEPLLEARSEGRAAALCSLDLGLTTVEVTLSPDGIEHPPELRLSWPQLEQIAGSDNSCFLVSSGSIQKIQLFSEETNRLYTLYPTPGAPTMLISGIPMHRIKGTEPHQDTLTKIKTITPITGRVLDTATGLGYTAIAAAETAEKVLTIELDPAASEIARLNPWSQPLFENAKIERLFGDSYEEIETFADSYFSRIIHDPPMFNLAGDLYSLDFYRQTWRVLARGGRMFHYIGDLESKSGKNVVRGVLSRLQQAGFTRLVRHPEAFGVVAFK